MRKSNYLWLLLVAVLLLPAQEMAAKRKREGSDRPRTLGGCCIKWLLRY